MRNSLLTFLLFFTALGTAAAQTAAISGTVTDARTGEKLAGAMVVGGGQTRGVITDADGAYTLNVPAGRQTLIASYLGYASSSTTVDVVAGQGQTVDFTLEATGLQGQEVTVSASRKAEKLTNAPATISVITPRVLSELPTFNAAEALGRQRGVDYVRTGVLGVGINARGFNSSFNPKNLQINDGRLSTLIATGLPLGALGTTVKEDIDRIEVVLGPSSALYGPNAHNGLVNTITKDPRTSPGTTVALGAGNQNVLTGRLRHAQVLNDKFAFKLTGEYTRGTEFDYTDSVYVGPVGYAEQGLDLDFNSVRGEASLYFTPVANNDLILTYGTSNSNNIGVTNAGRNMIRDWRINFLQLRYVSPRWFVQAYNTWSKTDSTFAMNQRTQNYWSFRNNGFSEEEAFRRSLREQWSPTAQAALNRSSLFQDASQRFNGEVQYNNSVAGFNYVVGAQYQRDAANSNGSYLLDNNGEGIDISQYGGYLQLDRFFGRHFKAVLAARADQHDLYGFNFIPKAAALWITENHAFRLTYGRGIAAPTILNLSANIFGGLLLGNGEGYTLQDGTVIDPLKVEKISTYELGAKGTFAGRFFYDANAYYNQSSDFLSPSINIATAANPVVKRGDEPIANFTSLPTFVLTYINFGSVNTYGFDLGLGYKILPALTANVNYSYFDYDLDESDKKNDGNRNGVVTPDDLPINTPTHKLNGGLTYSRGTGFFGSVWVRWVQAYDYFSGINVAAKTNREHIIGGTPVVENARVGRYWNYGPLGDFTNVDLAVGYKFPRFATIGAQVVNLFDSEVREFTGAPPIGRLYSVELKIDLPAIRR